MKRQSSLLAAIVALAAASFAAPASGAVEDQPGAKSCFYSNQWQGWRAPDTKHLYIRANVNDVYVAEMATACHGLRSPNATLISEPRGSTLICSPVDLNLKVSTDVQHGFASACFVKSLRKLSDAEVKALPKNARP